MYGVRPNRISTIVDHQAGFDSLPFGVRPYKISTIVVRVLNEVFILLDVRPCEISTIVDLIATVYIERTDFNEDKSILTARL